MGRRTRIVLGVAAALLLLAAIPAAGLIVGVASAQTGTPTAPGATTGQTFWEAVAARLGISVDQLTAAFKGAAKDIVAQELQAGKITQDQANQANGRIDGWQPGQRGPFEFEFGGRGMGREGMFGFDKSGMLDAAAKALGMTTADLTTELQSGKTLADVAKEKNVDANTVKQAMIDAAKAAVDAAVKAGKLTADQATQIKAKIDTMAANWDLSQPFMFHFGPGRGHGGWGGGWGNPNEAPGTTPQTPSTTPTGPSA